MFLLKKATAFGVKVAPVASTVMKKNILAVDHMGQHIK